MTIALPATFMRGGTSKALMFRSQDLPTDRADWDPLLLRAMGSPDPYGRQLNGMGGGLSSLSKVCVVGTSERPEADLDFTFAQVQIRRALVDYTGNCGNMSAAIGPFALAADLVKRDDGEATVLVRNTNTERLMRATFAVRGGLSVEEGDLAIPGVAGTGAPVRLDFLDPGGPATGVLLPTGSAADELATPLGTFTVSMIDAANACVFVAADDVGLDGTEAPEQLESRPDVLAVLAAIRSHAAVAMGLVPTPEAAADRPMTPFVAVLAAPRRYVTSSGEAVEPGAYALGARFISNGQPHRAIPGTGALCVAVAAQVSGSVASALVAPAAATGTGDRNGLGLGTPSGVVQVDADVERSPDGGWLVRSATSYRTFRRLFAGEVYA
jgi:2-methylaconitate cis-trans-isomerase PrpF